MESGLNAMSTRLSTEVKLTVVLPTFNEAENLPAMAAALASGGAWLAVRGPAAVARATHSSTVTNMESAKASAQSLAARSRNLAGGQGWFRPSSARPVAARSSGPTIEQQQVMADQQRG